VSTDAATLIRTMFMTHPPAHHPAAFEDVGNVLERAILEFAEARGDHAVGWDRPPLEPGAEGPWETVARRLHDGELVTATLVPNSGTTIEYRRQFGPRRIHLGYLTDRGRRRLSQIRAGL